MNDFSPDILDFAKGDGLLPVIVQDNNSLRILMLGYMNREALDETLRSGLVTFYSRSKQRLWQKGETSGHTLKLVSITTDCDQDALLARVLPQGPTCHTGAVSCFDQKDEGRDDLSFLADLQALIHKRHEEQPAGSYTTQLFQQGMPRMAQKVGEEGVEVALAATAEPHKLCEEAADLIYHLLVVLEASEKSLTDIIKVLRQRHKVAAK
ncbi:MAG: bifunctional phosphoribosyl-AMP cyclohydrolase/phosphoribosyl-ATP diphosphatase HisIE [Proteobacteria bacterium]|jgi:phosphoribosyl-ATP pyrophosphohydrolase/phosphoribosyl-AMP cyclohydrolase|nr:bifunctional phosphoribosyl-AMP cyclohydrolase/phosphoribosyl-ATP diphosphatase HisIE [Alphaproteobacteria bacterium]NCC04087.1 bifunctional phosphoribosyl-AMP cyclohydrolase/phosphoribosyl-ATP diphosphatase HisIE [Pseudomonadota bacterium]